MCVTVRFQGTKNKGGHGHLDIPVSYDGHVCNLPVKILWSFKNAVAFDNSVYILMAKWHVRVSKQSGKQANRLILWGVRSTTNKKNLFIFDLFCSKKLEKYDLIRHKVSKIHSHLDLKSLSFSTDSTNVLLPTP